uniref:Putative exonuclease n=1 Tax=viral metagenome TaxID=1070528 RepID=A0A6H1ZFG2_9ZZZZ
MIILDLEQRSPEWYQAKAGLPSASDFDKILTLKGEPSKSRQKYLYQLAGEKIIGVKEATYQSFAMQRGVELEAEARNYYELLYDSVQEVGLCLADNKLYGCSPDGLVGEDGGLEVKCPSLAVHIEYLLKGGLPSDYFQQVQGSLFVTGRKWWDFMSYYPNCQAHIIRVTPDKEFHRALAVELQLFCKELDEITKKLGG